MHQALSITAAADSAHPTPQQLRLAEAPKTPTALRDRSETLTPLCEARLLQDLDGELGAGVGIASQVVGETLSTDAALALEA